MTDLLCIGLTTLDILGRPIEHIPDAEGTTLIDEIEVVPAGTAGGAAMVAARLGVSVALASAIGDDRKGRIIRTELPAAGVDDRLLKTLPGAPSSATILPIDRAGRRPNFHALGASMMMTIDEELHAAAAAARVVHWGGIGAPGLDGGPGAALLAAARAAGAITTCDLIVTSPAVVDELKRVLPHVTWFLPSAAEALTLTGASTVEAAAEVFLGWGARHCLVKDGANGVVMVLEPGSARRFPAFDVVPVDTTSCGDGFCAGFVAGLLRGLTVEAAVRLGAATGALVAGGLGTLGKVQSYAATLAASETMAERAA